MFKMSSMINLEEGYDCINGTNVIATSRDHINDLGNLIENNHLKDDDMIIIYNGNPFIPEDTLNNAINVTKKYNAITSVIKEPDTLKLVDKNNFVEKTLDRDEYRKIQLRMIRYDFFKKKIIGYEFLRKIINIFDKSNLLKRIDNNIKKIILENPKW